MPVTSAEPKFNCSKCGKEYRWKPELAGKKAKCKCGNVVPIPAKPPAAARPAPKPASEDADLDGLYALAQEEKKATVRSSQVVDEGAAGYRCPSCSASMPPGAVVCPNCRLDMRTGTRQAAIGVGAGGGTVAAAGAYLTANVTGRGAGVLPYGGGGGGALSHAERASRDIHFEGGKVRSLYAPIGLIALGLALYFAQFALAGHKVSAALMIGYVFGRVVLDSSLILVAMLIAVKGFDMGFGAFGPGMLKILAVAMAPGALGDIVENMVGSSPFARWTAGAAVTLILTAVLIKVLFDLDLGETLLLTCLIYAIRRILATFLFVAIFGMANSNAISDETAGAVGSGAVAVATAGGDDEYALPKRVMDPDEIAHDLDQGALAVHRMAKGGADADDYFDGRPERRFVNMDHAKSVALVKALIAAGAKDVAIVASQEGEDANEARIELATALMLEMPTEPGARKKVFDIRADLLKSIGQPEVMVQVEAGGRIDEKLKQEPLKDWTQKYMVIHFGYEKNIKGFGEARFERRMKELEAQEKAEKAEEGKSQDGDKKPDASDDDDDE